LSSGGRTTEERRCGNILANTIGEKEMRPLFIIFLVDHAHAVNHEVEKPEVANPEHVTALTRKCVRDCTTWDGEGFRKGRCTTPQGVAAAAGVEGFGAGER